MAFSHTRVESEGEHEFESIEAIFAPDAVSTPPRLLLRGAQILR